MKIELTTEFNVGDILYALNEKEQITRLYIIKIIYEGEVTSENNFSIKYNILKNKNIIGPFTSDEIRDKFFISRRDLPNHIKNQI